MKKWFFVRDVTEIVPMIQDDSICTALHNKVIEDVELNFIFLYKL